MTNIKPVALKINGRSYAIEGDLPEFYNLDNDGQRIEEHSLLLWPRHQQVVIENGINYEIAY